MRWLKVSSSKQRLRDKIKQVEMQIESKRHLQNGFPLKDGRFFKQLDVALQSYNVERQSYFGGAFIGNHVHKALQPKNIETLCNSLT
ncbi:hypothetical protein EMCRGX_G021417 [Ephydatia muelleri]